MIFATLSFISFLILSKLKGGLEGLSESYYTASLSGLFMLISIFFWIKFFISLSERKRQLTIEQQRYNEVIQNKIDQEQNSSTPPTNNN